METLRNRLPERADDTARSVYDWYLQRLDTPENRSLAAERFSAMNLHERVQFQQAHSSPDLTLKQQEWHAQLTLLEPDIIEAIVTVIGLEHQIRDRY